MATPKFKLSGPRVGPETKRAVGILARDAGKSIEDYLGDLVTDVVRDRWHAFQTRVAEELNAGRESA